MKKIASVVVCVSALSLSACASIIENNAQKINVVPVGAQSANCELKNSRETVNSLAPATTQIRRSKTDLDINCSDNQTGATGKKTVESGLEPWTLANILLGVVIGLGVDFSTGSAWKYPSQIEVNMQPAQSTLVVPPLSDVIVTPQSPTISPAIQK
jgi:hypothetical protein